MSSPSGSRLIPLTLLAGILLLVPAWFLVPAWAEAIPLAPHGVEYRLSRNGLPVAVMEAHLEYDGKKYRYEMHTRAHNVLNLVGMAHMIAPNANLTEVSRGSLDAAGHYRPASYSYQRQNTERRELSIRFDWDSLRARMDSENRPWSMEIPAGTLDKLAVLLALRQDLSRGGETLTYAVADGGKLKTYSYRRKGETEINTAAGTWRGIELVRHKDSSAADYRLWLVPELENLPVVVEREEKGSSFRMELLSRHLETAPEIDGKKRH